MAAEPATYSTWYKDPEWEAQMGAGHEPYWRHFIMTIPETDLSEKSVLDFGCNRGGFLRLLHALRPFRRGLGIDLARDSIATARSLTNGLPITYEVASDLAPWAGEFDIAFSYEVVYLLPNLRAHAEQISRALCEGGVYYAVTGCHTDSHLWPLWRQTLTETSNATVHDYAPEDYIDAFASQGFRVSFRQFGFDGFVPAPVSPQYYPKAVDALIYTASDKLLFRAVKPGR